MLLKSTAPICPVCLSGSSPGWASACDDADRMTAGAHRGECQCGREQFPHDLQHIQTYTHTHTHTHIARIEISLKCVAMSGDRL